MRVWVTFGEWVFHSCSLTFQVKGFSVLTILHYMRDHAWCLTPILQGSRDFLEVWRLNFIVTRVCYIMYQGQIPLIKSWILKKSHDWVLSNIINYTHPARAEITGIWQGIEFFVVKYWHWVKSEASIPKRLGILRTPVCLVSLRSRI